MHGPDTGHGARRRRVGARAALAEPHGVLAVCLRTPYAVSSTDIAYGGNRHYEDPSMHTVQ
eukprot:229536-Rhodomonas_salina.1